MKLGILFGIFVLLFLFNHFFFLQKGKVEDLTGTIHSRTENQPESYNRSHVSGSQRGFQTSSPISIAASVTFEVQIDETSEIVRSKQNIEAAKTFKVGDKVALKVERKGLPGLFQKSFVIDMQPKNH